MNERAFREYLITKKVEKKDADAYLDFLNKYQKFLKKENLTLETVDPKRVVEFTEQLVIEDKDSVIIFLLALMNYANFSEKREFITSAIDLLESYNAMDNLNSRIAEIHGPNVRDEIFEGLTIPPLGVHPEKKPEFTKIIMKRIEEKLGEKKTIELLVPCLHGRPYDDFEQDRKDYKKLGIDDFLKKKHQKLIQNFEKNREEGTYSFAQPVDEEVVEYIRNTPTIGAGVREGNVIFVTKIPYQTKKYLHAKDDSMKRFYICYCPWIRGAIKNGTEHEISTNFCHCSAGWFKLYWDKLFQQPIKVEPVETALKGDTVCKFAVHLPEDVIIK